MCVCECVCACAWHACVHLCVCVSECARVFVHLCMLAELVCLTCCWRQEPTVMKARLDAKLDEYFSAHVAAEDVDAGEGGEDEADGGDDGGQDQAGDAATEDATADVATA